MKVMVRITVMVEQKIKICLILSIRVQGSRLQWLDQLRLMGWRDRWETRWHMSIFIKDQTTNPKEHSSNLATTATLNNPQSKSCVNPSLTTNPTTRRSQIRCKIRNTNISKILGQSNRIISNDQSVRCDKKKRKAFRINLAIKTLILIDWLTNWIKRGINLVRGRISLLILLLMGLRIEA